MFTTQQVARDLKMTPRNLLAFAKSHRIKAWKRIGRSLIWSPDNIAAIRQKRRHKPTPTEAKR
jgi:hypothetical protein